MTAVAQVLGIGAPETIRAWCTVGRSMPVTAPAIENRPEFHRMLARIQAIFEASSSPRHKSAATTLDTYADLFYDDLDDVATRLDERATAADVGKVWANLAA